MDNNLTTLTFITWEHGIITSSGTTNAGHRILTQVNVFVLKKCNIRSVRLCTCTITVLWFPD